MEIKVFVPSPLFETAEQFARQLGLSRDEFYATALAAYVESLQRSDVTRALNDVYGKEQSAIDPSLVQLQSASMPEETW